MGHEAEEVEQTHETKKKKERKKPFTVRGHCRTIILSQRTYIHNIQYTNTPIHRTQGRRRRHHEDLNPHMMSSPYDVNVNMNTPPMATAVPIPFHSDDAPTNAAPAKAMPPMMAVNEWNDAPDLRPEQLRQLEEGQGFPRGLAAGLGRTRAVYPIRFWVVDNSGACA